LSGRPFDQYIAENILKPLNMTHSTFKQPLPTALTPFMSSGYRLASDKPGQFEIVNAFPAGSLSSSATDMAQFMIAHLQDGQLGGAHILKPETARLMHSRLFALDDAANAMCYGFYEETSNGQRIIGHGGDTIYFHSDLHLILDQKVGFFVSYNSAGKTGGLGDSPRTTLWGAFLDRYYPHSVQAQPVAGAKEAPKAVSGTYTLSRRGETSFVRLASLLGQFTVTPAGDEDIEVSLLTGANGKPKRWQAVSPTTFIEREGQDKLIFKPDQQGKLQIILPFPFFIGQSVGQLENGKLLLLVLGVSLFIMLATLILWPVAWLVRWHYGHKLELTLSERLLRFGVRIVFLLDLVFVAAFLLLLTYGFTHLEILSSQGTKWFYLVQTIGVIGAIGTIVALLNAVFSWKSKRKRIAGKLASTIMLLACLGLLWFSFAGNLLHFTSTY